MQWRRELKENLSFLLKVFIVSLLIVNFVGRASVVKGSSMEPEIHTEERIFINLFVYRFEPPLRGDVVVFRYPRDPSRDYIKRVVGLPGDMVEIRNGAVYVNGAPLVEPYVRRGDRSAMGARVVPPKHLFVLGDNRASSEDSRAFGSLPLGLVRGKAICIFWPMDHLRLIR